MYPQGTSCIPSLNSMRLKYSEKTLSNASTVFIVDEKLVDESHRSHPHR